ncbi:MAG: ABC transporter ATP-binding protein, partial [Acidimicrobiales bacterium]
MTVETHDPDDIDDIDGRPVQPPEPPSRSFAGGRFGSAGMPAEKTKDLAGSTRRLLATMAPERLRAVSVVVAAVVSVTLAVIGPRVLGRGTDIIVEGLSGRTDGIAVDRLGRVLLIVIALYAVSALLSYVQSYLLAGVVQRTMYRLRSDVEDKLHRLSLSYVDGQPRGDLLSRVTNDIDNIAQSLQQTMSQLLTSTLTIVGVLVMMFLISPVLALIALVTIPTSLVVVRAVTARS